MWDAISTRIQHPGELCQSLSPLSGRSSFLKIRFCGPAINQLLGMFCPWYSHQNIGWSSIASNLYRAVPDAVHFLRNPFIWHPIAPPLGCGMGCLLWVQLLILILLQFLQWYMQYCFMLNLVITALDLHVFSINSPCTTQPSPFTGGTEACRFDSPHDANHQLGTATGKITTYLIPVGALAIDLKMETRFTWVLMRDHQYCTFSFTWFGLQKI